MMPAVIHIAIPDETTVLAAAQQAAAAGFLLVTNGERTLISPIVPKGYHKIVVRLPNAPERRS